MAWLGPAISAGSSLFGGLFGNSQGKKAGKVLADAGNKAQGIVTDNRDRALRLQQLNSNQGLGMVGGNADRALGIQRGMWDTTQANQNPFLQAGQEGIGTLSQLLKNGSLTPKEFVSPTAATEQNDPGYQFRYNEGLRALDAGAAARGTVLSGGQRRAEQQYGQDYASNEFGNAYNRAVNDYQLGIQNQNNTFNRYATLGQFGSTAANQLGAVGTALSGQSSSTLNDLSSQQGGLLSLLSQLQSGTLNSSGQEQANYLMQGAGGEAGGIVGGSNALSGGIMGAGDGLTQLLATLKRSKQSGYGGGTAGGYDSGGGYISYG